MSPRAVDYYLDGEGNGAVCKYTLELHKDVGRIGKPCPILFSNAGVARVCGCSVVCAHTM